MWAGARGGEDAGQSSLPRLLRKSSIHLPPRVATPERAQPGHHCFEGRTRGSYSFIPDYTCAQLTNSPGLSPRNTSTMRSTRKSSRTSSPYPNHTSSPAPGLVSKKEKAQTSLDSWVEPPPKNPIASFEEHGFARHGVLENMAPLGQPPTAKLKAKLRGGQDMHRHSLLNRNGNMSTGEDALSTPEMTPAAEPERAPTEPAEEEEPVPLPSLEAQDETEDDEYIPNGVRSTSRSGKAAMKNGVKATTPRRASTIPPTSTTPTTRTPGGNQIMLKAVNAAMKKAHEDGRPAVGDAVRRLYDDSCHNQIYARLLDAILNERATTQEQAEFRTYIKAAKREAKARDRQVMHARTNSLRGSPAVPAKTRNSSTPGGPDTKPTTIANTIGATIATAPTTPMVPAVAQSATASSYNPLSNVPHLLPAFSPNHHSNNLFSASSRPTSPPIPSVTNGISQKDVEMVETRRQRRAAANAAAAPVVAPVFPPTVAPTTASTTASTKKTTTKTPKSPAKPKGKAVKKVAPETDDSELSDVNEEIIMSEAPEPMESIDDLAAPPKKPQRLILKVNSNSKGKRPKSSTATPVPMSGKRSADEAGMDEEDMNIQVKKQRMRRTFPDFHPVFSAIRSQEDVFAYQDNALTSIEQVAPAKISSAATRRPGRSRKGSSEAPPPKAKAKSKAAPKQNGVNAYTPSTGMATPTDGPSVPPSPRAAAPRRAASVTSSKAITRPTTPAANPPKRRKTHNGPAKTKIS